MKLQDNILKLYLLKGFLWFMIAMPIIVLFFQENGLTLMEVMILQSVYSLTIAITEIPSGYFADSFGRKNSITLGSIFIFLGYLIFSNYTGFEIFILAEILVAIGGSLMSGADSAIMYDTLFEINKENQYTRVEGKTYAIGNFSEAAAGLVVTFLATISLLLPVQIQTAILFFCIPISLSLVEPSINNKSKLEGGYKAMLKIVRYSLCENLKLKWLIVYSSIIGVASLSAAWLAQPFFKFIETEIYYYGILWALLNFTAGVGSYRSYRIENLIEDNVERFLLVMGLFMSLSFLLVYFFSNYFGIIFIFIIYHLRGILTPILKNQINLNTESNTRATVMSVRSFMLRISFAIIAPVLGLMADSKGISNSFLLLSALIIVFISISVFRLMKVK